MTYETHLTRSVADLKAAEALISEELRAYPTPVSGCDAQYNHLLGMRNAIGAALRSLGGPEFVATPRTPVEGAEVESR